MFSISSADTTITRTSESHVFLLLKTGAAPFPLKSAVVLVLAQFAKPTTTSRGEAAPLSDRSVPRFSPAAARLINVFRHRQVVTAPIDDNNVEPTGFTSTENLRPDPLSLDTPHAARTSRGGLRRSIRFEAVRKGGWAISGGASP